MGLRWERRPRPGARGSAAGLSSAAAALAARLCEAEPWARMLETHSQSAWVWVPRYTYAALVGLH